jgi:hypothetical protein
MNKQISRLSSVDLLLVAIHAGASDLAGEFGILPPVLNAGHVDPVERLAGTITPSGGGSKWLFCFKV